MIRDERFLISRRPYAIDLGSLRTVEHDRDDGSHYYSGRVDAVWYRRRQGVTVACIGTLWDYQDVQPEDGRTFLEHHEDGRYGGDCVGRWDGTGYWGTEVPDVQKQHLAVLRPMLAAYPVIPEGYDGWWRF